MPTNTAVKRDTVTSLRAELEAYKNQVREVVLANGDEDGWSSEEINELLYRLSLPPMQTKYYGTVTVFLLVNGESFDTDDIREVEGIVLDRTIKLLKDKGIDYSDIDIDLDYA